MVEITSLILIAKDPLNLQSQFKNFISTFENIEIENTEILLITTVDEISFNEIKQLDYLNIRIFIVSQLDFIETGFNFGIQNSIGDDLILVNLDDFRRKDFAAVLDLRKSGAEIIAVKPVVIRNIFLNLLKKIFDTIYRYLVGNSIDQETISILRINRRDINNSWVSSNPVVKIRRLVIENSGKVTVVRSDSAIKKSKFYKDDIAKGLLLLTTSSTKLLRVTSTTSLFFSVISGFQALYIFLRFFLDKNMSLTFTSLAFGLSMLFCLIFFTIAIVFELIIAEINNRNVSGSANIREIGNFGIFRRNKTLNIEVENLD
jgi:hypothetical protein